MVARIRRSDSYIRAFELAVYKDRLQFSMIFRSGDSLGGDKKTEQSESLAIQKKEEAEQRKTLARADVEILLACVFL